MDPVLAQDIDKLTFFFFFFSPRISELKYQRSFEKLADHIDIGIMYSPFYVLRREIDKLCNMRVPYAKSNKFSFAPDSSRYAALLLADIAIAGIVFNLTAREAGKKAQQNDFYAFYQKYLHSDGLTAFLMRCLRNSLQHNFFDMKYHLSKPEAQIFRTLTGIKYRGKIKIYFDPVWDETSDIFYDKYWEVNSYTVYLNLAEYFRRLNRAFKRLKRDAEKDPVIRKNFYKNISMYDWVPIESEP